MSDTYNYNAGSPFGGLGGLFGGGNGCCNNGNVDLMSILGFAIVASVLGLNPNAAFGGGPRGAMPGYAGGVPGGDVPSVTASLVGQQQVADRVASINTGVDAIAGLVSAQGAKLETVKDAVVNGFYANQTNLCQAFNNQAMQAVNNHNNLTSQMTDMRFAQQQCCCDTRAQIESKFCNLTHQIQSDKCDTLRAIADEGAATRAMLRDMETRKLQEELAAAKAQLSQNAQTAAIINAVQANCSPCAPKCGCGNGYAYGFNPGAGKCGDLLCSVQNAFADEIAQRIINPTTTAAAA